MRTRIIPAYAGSTSTSLPGPQPAQDHPRIRGEHMHVYPPVARFDGSSPHTRGALFLGVCHAFFSRIIPAYAGSTRHRPRRPSPSWNHPRIRGEHSASKRESSLSPGSSPHTRGALVEIGDPMMRERIIPAYAGSTRPARPDWPSRTDHPRIRGEHRMAESPPYRRRGSSPHTRGARAPVPTENANSRIIPAYAGSTTATNANSPTSTDHPRIRGEHRDEAGEGPVGPGSSPHTRGAHFYHIPSVFPPRIIPAYAGSTSWRARSARS